MFSFIFLPKIKAKTLKNNNNNPVAIQNEFEKKISENEDLVWWDEKGERRGMFSIATTS